MNLDFFKEKFYTLKERITAVNFKEKCSLPYLKSMWKKFRATPQRISKVCIILSLYTILVFNIPAFSLVTKNLKGSDEVILVFIAIATMIAAMVSLLRNFKNSKGVICSSTIMVCALITILFNTDCNWNGVVIFSSVAILLFVLNYFLYYLLLWLGRVVGKVIISLTFILNAVCLYSINTFEAYITEPTIANVFNTRYSEASSFISISTFVYIIFLGIPPCIYLFAKKIDYSKFWKLLVNIFASLLIVISVVIANWRNILWIDQNATLLGGRLMPWSYIVNSIRHVIILLEGNQKEIMLPDAKITTDSKDVCVLIIGESARRENFSLYGYHRNTNPLLAGDGVKAYYANSEDVSTIGGVKAILSYKSSKKLYEILPNYLYRTGVDVVWRTNNWGEPPLHIEKYYNKEDLAARYPNEDKRYDGVMFAGLAEEIENCDKDKQLIVIHCYTSHGPKYYANYPAKFEKFTPVCKSTEMSSINKQELVNAYDNTILYTDYLVHSVIETLKQVEGKRCCMIFVSDHGESLGEDDMFMHGTLPKRFAPKQQFEIPFIVWENDSCTKTKELGHVEQFYVYHSVMNWLGIESPIYNENMNVFEPENIEQDGTAQ